MRGLDLTQRTKWGRVARSEARTAEEEQRFKKQYSEYTPTEGYTKRDLHAPKKAMSSYMLYSHDHRQAVKAKLTSRAEELGNRMRGAIGSAFISKDTEICTRYQEIFIRLGHHPSTEEERVELETFLGQSTGGLETGPALSADSTPPGPLGHRKAWGRAAAPALLPDRLPLARRVAGHRDGLRRRGQRWPRALPPGVGGLRPGPLAVGGGGWRVVVRCATFGLVYP